MSTTEQLVHSLGSILQAVLSPDDAQRKSAEHQLDGYVNDAPGETLYGLMLIGQGVAGYPYESRALSLVLLRRLAFRSPLLSSDPTSSLPASSPLPSDPSTLPPFDRISEASRTKIEGSLLSMLEEEMDGRLRKGCGEVVGRWVEESVKSGRPLPSLPPLLLKLSSSPLPLHRLTPLHLLISNPLILSYIPAPSPSSISTNQIAHLLTAALQDPVDEIRVEAVGAMTSWVEGEGCGKKGRGEVGVGLVGRGFEALQSLYGEHFAKPTTSMIGLATTHPELFTSHLATCLPYLQSLCLPPPFIAAYLPPFLNPSTYTTLSAPPLKSTSSVEAALEEDDERFNVALELLMTILEGSKKGSIRRFFNGQGVGEMLPVLLGRMVMGLGSHEEGKAREELQEWLEQEDLDEDDENYPVAPEDGLDRLAQIMPGKQFLTPIGTYFAQLVSSPDWRARHVALMAIAAVGEGLQDALATRLPQIIFAILPLAQDPHPRVRYAVSHAFGQLATDFEEQIQDDEVANKVLEIEIGMLADPEARVAAHAAAALVNFCDGSDADKLRPYLDEIVKRVVALLNGRPIYVQEQALTTMASVALTAEKDFAVHYGTMMPMLLMLLQQPNDKQHRVLKSRGMECAGLIGMAVGKQQFAQDAMTLANSLVQIQNSITDDDDPQSSYLTTTWAKIATALGPDFQPFMGHVMPPLLAKCAIKPAVISSKDAANDVEEDGWEYIEMQSDMRIGIKTSAMEEKATAFEMLATYLVEVGAAGMAPFLEETLNVCLGNLNFIFDERVREAAVTMLPAILQISKEVGYQDAPGRIFKDLNEAILKETDMEYSGQIYAKYGECLKILGNPLPADMRKSFEDATRFQLETMGTVRKFREQQQGQWDHSERLAEVDMEECENIALDEILKAVYLLDPNSPLLMMAGSVKELGKFAGTVDWEEEDDDDE